MGDDRPETFYHQGRVADRVLGLLESLSEVVDGFAVDQLTHCLQTATRAERAGADDELVVASLCHDIGKAIGGPQPPADRRRDPAPLRAPRGDRDHRSPTRTSRGGTTTTTSTWTPTCVTATGTSRGTSWPSGSPTSGTRTSFDPDYPTEPLSHFEPKVRAVFGYHHTRSDGPHPASSLVRAVRTTEAPAGRPTSSSWPPTSPSPTSTTAIGDVRFGPDRRPHRRLRRRAQHRRRAQGHAHPASATSRSPPWWSWTGEPTARPRSPSTPAPTPACCRSTWVRGPPSGSAIDWPPPTGARYVVTLDADGQNDPAEIDRHGAAAARRRGRLRHRLPPARGRRDHRPAAPGRGRPSTPGSSTPSCPSASPTRPTATGPSAPSCSTTSSPISSRTSTRRPR